MSEAERERIYQTAVKQLQSERTPNFFQRGIHRGMWDKDARLILPLPSSFQRLAEMIDNDVIAIPACAES
jgi:hypothetical protein